MVLLSESKASCDHSDVVDTSRTPTLDVGSPRRLTCTRCGLVTVNIDGEHNPDLDLAALAIPTDPALDTGCDGCQ